MRGHREFMYIGEPVPKIDLYAHSVFVLQLQKALLLSLVEKKLLSTSQMQRIMDELERKHIESKQQPGKIPGCCL